MNITPIKPETLQSIESALALYLQGEVDWSITTPILIPEKPGSKKKGVASSLIMEPPQDVDQSGECPGGKYWYIDDIERALDLLDYWTYHQVWAAIDIETGASYRETINARTGRVDRAYSTSPDPYTSPLYLCSISVKPGESIVFDMRTLMEDKRFAPMFRAFLMNCKLVAHNALFEGMFFLVKFQVVGNFVFDTMIAHQVATAGTSERNGLDDLIEKYYGEKMDKTYQRYFLKIHYNSPIRNDAIVYAAGDTCYLLDLAKKVEETLRSTEMFHIWEEIEQPFLEEVIRAKVHGIPLNVELLEELRESTAKEVDDIRARFAKLVGTKTVTKRGREPYEEACVNIASNTQLLKWFAEQGVKTPNVDEDALKDISKNNAGTLAAKVADTVLEDRGVSKFLSTYVRPFLGKSRNYITGRIHPDFKQASTKTGRMASANPNGQNIPSDLPYSRIRNAFVAMAGHKLIIADFSQFEVRALADMAGEGKMIQVFLEGHKAGLELKAYCKENELPEEIASWKTSDKEEKKAKYQAFCDLYPGLDPLVVKVAECDFHTRTASQLFNIPPAQVTKEQRKNAKTITFALPYGAGPPGISRQSNLTVKQAEVLMNSYYNTYRAVKIFLDRCRQQAKMGSTQTPAGRKRYYPRPNKEKIRLEKVAQKEEYEKLYVEALAQVETIIEGLNEDQIKKSEPDPMDPEGEFLYQVDKKGWINKDEWVRSLLKKTEWAKVLKTWHINNPVELAERIARSQLGGIEREGTNQPIQGINADATKYASILIGKRLRQLDERCVIILWVHDEIVVVVPDELVAIATEIVERSMIEAAEKWIKKVPMEVAITVSQHWLK